MDKTYREVNIFYIATSLIDVFPVLFLGDHNVITVFIDRAYFSGGNNRCGCGFLNDGVSPNYVVGFKFEAVIDSSINIPVVKKAPGYS